MGLEDTLRGQLNARKNAHFMLVDGMSKLKTYQVNECQSSIFDIGGVKWKLIVNPAGEDGKKHYVSFYLKVKDKKSLPTDWEVKCTLKLLIVSQTETNSCKAWERFDVCYNANNRIHGAENFMRHNELNAIAKGYLVNDKAVFGAEVTDVDTNFSVTVIPRAKGTAERVKLDEVPRNKSRFTWKITQFSSFTSTYHSSYEFTVGPRKWKLLMYPKGHLEGTGNSLSVFLTATDYQTNGLKAKTLAVFKLRVLDQLRRNHCESDNGDVWFGYHPDNPYNSSRGWDKLLPMEKLKDPSMGYLLDDVIYIGVEFLLVSTTTKNL